LDHTSGSAFQKPSAPSATASSGPIARPRRLRSSRSSFHDCALIRERGVTIGTVFQNQKPGAYASKLWAVAGLTCVGIGTNVDDQVKIAAINHALKGVECLILVASDGGYDEVIHAIRRCGVRVELWALRNAVASHLVFAADTVRWIDGFLQEPSVAA
jgi:hypothetical protein